MEMNFLDELLKAEELKDEQRTEAYYDLLLMNIRQMQKQIEYNFQEAEKECAMIDSFILNKNAQIQDRIHWLEIKLEAFIKEKGVKTIALPSGTLKMYKKADRIIVEDLDLFLKKAKPEMLTIIPEEIRPDLNKIKNYIKTRPVPPGVKILEGSIEFSYKLNQESEVENAREKKTGVGVEQNPEFRAAV